MPSLSGTARKIALGIVILIIILIILYLCLVAFRSGFNAILGFSADSGLGIKAISQDIKSQIKATPSRVKGLAQKLKTSLT